MIGRDVALQVLWRKDAMLQQLTYFCVGRNIEAPVSRQETEWFPWIPMAFAPCFSAMTLEPLILWLAFEPTQTWEEIWTMVNRWPGWTVDKFDPTQLQKHFHCHGPYSSPKEGHLHVRQQHGRVGSGVFAASVTWLSQADPMCRGHDWTLIGFRVRFLVNCYINF